MSHICRLAEELDISIVLSHPEREYDGTLYNSAFLIDATGCIRGRHRKHNVASDQWSRRGDLTGTIKWSNITLGLLICADAYTEEFAAKLKAEGAQMLLSPAAWGPGLYGPNGEWEKRTLETGLPLIVCNRTGEEPPMNFSNAESLIIKHGRKLLSHCSATSMVLTVSWDLERIEPISTEFMKDTL
jgi:predicted amidohydrolase